MMTKINSRYLSPGETMFYKRSGKSIDVPQIIRERKLRHPYSISEGYPKVIKLVSEQKIVITENNDA